MTPLLLALPFADPAPASLGPGSPSVVPSFVEGRTGLLPAPTLARDPWERAWGPGSPFSHGPDGPDDVPEDGYGFKASKKDSKKLLWVGLSSMAVGGLVAASARSQSFTMREAQTLSELNAAYDKQRKLAYTSYSFLGAGALCMILEIPF